VILTPEKGITPFSADPKYKSGEAASLDGQRLSFAFPYRFALQFNKFPLKPGLQAPF
jgi:hypothetical protein